MPTERRESGPPWMLIVFPGIALAVGAIVVYWRIRAGAHPALWVIPPLVGAATYLGLRRVMRPLPLPSTTHAYSVFAPAGADPELGAILDALEARGYQPVTATIDEMGAVGPKPGRAVSLVGHQVRVTDQRAPESLGMIVLRLRRGDGDGVTGIIESVDTGPGLYDEMAQFVVVELARLLPGAEYAAPAKGGAKPGARRPASDLAPEVPEKPLGLAML